MYLIKFLQKYYLLIKTVTFVLIILKNPHFVLLKLRNLHNYSVDDMSKKLNITREDYRNLEKGSTQPSKEVSKMLYQIFEIVS